ncbi:putative cation-transporting ATPase 2 [Kluyveromyces marxianus]|uniref:Cation-transporting ATPase n=1 Tax=Kluyveromyces marxianus TaxID=4911 RepID=A0ABX6F0I5_KLUMA|nr:putative cation-transporting ATPase 2 [Kluyveromyces marxianus]
MSVDNKLNGMPRRSNQSARPSFSSTRTGSSTNTTASVILEQNNSEPYSGAAVETVPSSIVSFYHPHSFQSSGYGVSASSSNFERRGQTSENENDALLLSASTSRRSSASRGGRGFHFFTEAQVENAEGISSSLENADYDMDWDAIPTYEQERLHIQPKSSKASLRHNSNDFAMKTLVSQRQNSLRSHPLENRTYSTSPRSSSSSSRYTLRDRIPAELEPDETNDQDDTELRSNESSEEADDDDLSNEDYYSRAEENQEQAKKSYHAKFLKPEYHDRFFPHNVPHLHYQRFYIAEEDLVVAIAGYRTSQFKLYCYYFLCIISLGFAYLLFRWKPSMKVKLSGVKTPLGKAEWVVIENEFGELTIEPVKRRWYNRPLSTVLMEINEDRINPPEDHHYHHETSSNPNLPILITFNYRYFTLVYSPVADIFKSNSNWADPDWLDLEQVQKGLSSSIQEDRTLAFGKNAVNLKQKTVFEILFDEALHPFYVFQIFSIVLWLADDYYYYAGCIFIISVLSIIDTVLETRKNSARLAEMSHFSCEVRVYKDGFWTQVNSSELVPGDLFEISDPSLTALPCDAVLISGDCIVNESMLTGESVPVSKFAATESTMVHLLEDFKSSQVSSIVSRSFLFNGTKIIRVRSQPGMGMALALVTRTGFSTTKGSLIRSMVFPKPVGFKFYEDSFKYIGFMTLIAMLGFSISCIQFIRLGLEVRIMILRALDIITIVVPPALPATLTIGTSFALTRLKKKGIFCISPTRVNVGGKVDLMCFDKTGTLTEEGLDVLGVHFAEPKGSSSVLHLSKLITSCDDLIKKDKLSDCNNQKEFKEKNLFMSLLTCHSLRNIDGELLGDPLDFKMFEFTKWEYEEGYESWKFKNGEDKAGISPAVVHPTANSPFIENDPNNLIGIVRSFEFLSELRRMSVIVKGFKENNYWSYTKGAPEIIADICNPSTIPKNFHELLQYYTHNGFRVIACAGKSLAKNSWLYSQKVSREEVEDNLEFLGFIVFENKLKTRTKQVLHDLRDANIRTVMCTGDNVLTAVSVGRESGLITSDRVFIPSINENLGENDQLISWRDVDDPNSFLDSVSLEPLTDPEKSYSLAITGDIFRILFRNDEILPENYINTILLKGSIYARMSPDEKHELVEQLQKLDYNVGFCGDGANDCGALKAANIGISLSEAEASVAAPFTSSIFDISCVLDVIKEGRASLVTSFSCFQYMSLYSAIQFITITILYSRGSNLGDFQFLYIDLLLIVPIAISMSWSKPSEKLVKKRPSANLVSPKILVPLCLNIIIILIFQLIPWIAVQYTSWYLKPIPAGDDAVQSSDNTVLFFVSNFQYILTAVILSQGPPYREPLTKNYGFVIDISVSLIMSFALMNLNVNSPLGKLLQLTNISGSFKWFIIATVIANFYSEKYIPEKAKNLFKKKYSSKRYKNILRMQQQAVNV